MDLVVYHGIVKLNGHPQKYYSFFLSGGAESRLDRTSCKQTNKLRRRNILLGILRPCIKPVARRLHLILRGDSFAWMTGS